MADEGRRPDRLHRAVEAELDPGSLVGSFFHADESRQWQGCVVAEPAPGVFLVELFEWITGSPDVQRLVRIGDMAGWQFYDDIEWMNNTYRYGTIPWPRPEPEPGETAP
jgi:hypothetical protein